MVSTVPPTVLFHAVTIRSFTNALSAPTPAVLAGGPAAVPIPSNCTVIILAPTLGQMRNELYIPTADAESDILYSAYYPSPSTNKTMMSLQCFQQCGGYGDGKLCETTFWAGNMPVSESYYGTPAGQLETA